MDELFDFVSLHLAFLFRSGRYRIIDGLEAESGNAYLILSSPRLAVLIFQERSQLAMQFSPPATREVLLVRPWSSWYGVGLVERLISGKTGDQLALDESSSRFVRYQLEDIEELFGSTPSATIRRLKRLKGEVD